MAARKPFGLAQAVAPSSADLTRRILKHVGIVAFCFYVAWNIYWLAHRTIPPSILRGIFGLPAPTTGMTRSLRALLSGDLAGSVFWNAFLIPVLLLFASSFVSLSISLLKRRRLVLPKPIAYSWFAILATAWLTKFIQGSPSW